MVYGLFVLRQLGVWEHWSVVYCQKSALLIFKELKFSYLAEKYIHSIFFLLNFIFIYGWNFRLKDPKKYW